MLPTSRCAMGAQCAPLEIDREPLPTRRQPGARRARDDFRESEKSMATEVTTAATYSFTEKKRIRKSFAKRASVRQASLLLEPQLSA